MAAGYLARIIASILLALYLMAPGSVIVHILEEMPSLGHAEEPVHLEQPAPLKGGMQSGSLPCDICEHGEKVLPGSRPAIVHLPFVPAYPASADRYFPLRCADPPFIPPEANV